MYVTVVPNRGSPPAILLRETYREGGTVKNRTLANLTRWKPEKIAALRAVLREETLRPAGDGFEILRSLPHGHVAAALGTARRPGARPPRQNRRADAAGSAAHAVAGAGPDRGAADRSRRQAGHRARPRCRDRGPFAGRGAGPRRGRGQRAVRDA